MSRGIEKRIVLLDDPYNQPEEPWMEFRLTYQGLLLSTQRDPLTHQRDANADHKHEIRRVFHRQLKRLWEVTPFLRTGQRSGPGLILDETGPDVNAYYDVASIASRSPRYSNFRFVPLVRAELALICGIDVLFLRPHPPGEVIQSGDIDNRLKTLFDALRLPAGNERYENRAADGDELPYFFCLLDDDRLITKFSVETDQLLETEGSNLNEVMLVITVRLRPYDVGLHNLQFA